MLGLLTWLATLAAALFAGGALYVSLAEHPARLACGPPMAVAEFRTSYPRAARLQGSLAAVGILCGVGAWLGGAPATSLAAGLLLSAVIAFTLVGMMPTSRRLLDRGLGPDTPEADRLLRRWGALHAIRTLLGLGALGLMLASRAGG
jgi:hypothetical protein